MSKKQIIVPKNTNNFNVEAASTEKSLFDEEALGGRLSNLSVSIQSWLRKRGQIVNSAIPEHQRKQIRECFDMIDTDGSGALDVKEVFELFEVCCWPSSAFEIVIIAAVRSHGACSAMSNLTTLAGYGDEGDERANSQNHS